MNVAPLRHIHPALHPPDPLTHTHTTQTHKHTFAPTRQPSLMIPVAAAAAAISEVSHRTALFHLPPIAHAAAQQRREQSNNKISWRRREARAHALALQPAHADRRVLFRHHLGRGPLHKESRRDGEAPRKEAERPSQASGLPSAWVAFIQL